MKVLDLFCGKGGWSVPFIEDGAHVVGVDIKDLHYPGHLILEDARNIDGHTFRGYDLIIGSPPCAEFSKLKIGQGNIAKGLELITTFNRIVSEAKPRFWAMENVTELERHYPIKPIWRFYIGRGGKRTLWGNLSIPLTPDFRFPKRIKDHASKERRLDRKSVV